MRLDDFRLERFFAKHEFTAKYLLSASDCESITLDEILSSISKEELEEWKKLRIGYTESQGSEELRYEISKFYNSFSIENIIVASPGELNFALMNVLLNEKDHVICMRPAYQSLYEVSKSIDCELSFWNFNENSWTFEIQALKKLVKTNTKLIILNLPHNPTGSYITFTQLKEIIALAKEVDAYIFSDEMYHKLVIDDRYKELPPISTIYRKGISLCGMSKSFGMAGLRIGWLASQDVNVINKVLFFKDYLSICNGILSEKIAFLVLKDYKRFLNENLKIINSNIYVFEELCKKYNDIITFKKPISGSVALAQLNIGLSASEFSKKLIEETSIMALPSSQFDMKDEYIRIGFGRKNFSKYIHILDGFLKREFK